MNPEVINGNDTLNSVDEEEEKTERKEREIKRQMNRIKSYR